MLNKFVNVCISLGSQLSTQFTVHTCSSLYNWSCSKAHVSSFYVFV